jgi:hypothetical protein
VAVTSTAGHPYACRPQGSIRLTFKLTVVLAHQLREWHTPYCSPENIPPRIYKAPHPLHLLRATTVFPFGSEFRFIGHHDLHPNTGTYAGGAFKVFVYLHSMRLHREFADCVSKQVVFSVCLQISVGCAYSRGCAGCSQQGVLLAV